MQMRKFRIAIEETVGQEIEIYAENAEQAIAIAENKYNNGEIVLELGELKFKQMAVVSPKNEVTEWTEF